MLIEICCPVFMTLSNICYAAFHESNWIFLKKSFVIDFWKALKFASKRAFIELLFYGAHNDATFLVFSFHICAHFMHWKYLSNVNVSVSYTTLSHIHNCFTSLGKNQKMYLHEHLISNQKTIPKAIASRGGSRAAATCKMECFVIIVNSH